jgi:hypothetical protein
MYGRLRRKKGILCMAGLKKERKKESINNEVAKDFITCDELWMICQLGILKFFSICCVFM